MFLGKLKCFVKNISRLRSSTGIPQRFREQVFEIRGIRTFFVAPSWGTNILCSTDGKECLKTHSLLKGTPLPPSLLSLCQRHICYCHHRCCLHHSHRHCHRCHCHWCCRSCHHHRHRHRHCHGQRHRHRHIIVKVVMMERDDEDRREEEQAGNCNFCYSYLYLQVNIQVEDSLNLSLAWRYVKF